MLLLAYSHILSLSQSCYHNCFNRFQLPNPNPSFFFFNLLGKRGFFLNYYLFFNKNLMYRWYSEKFVEGQWTKDKCVSGVAKIQSLPCFTFLHFAPFSSINYLKFFIPFLHNRLLFIGTFG